MSEEELLKALLPEKVLESAYKDALSAPAKEAGKLATDVIKTARLFLAPFQLGAAFQDRLAKMLTRVSERVPESRRMSPPAEVSGPALERMRYLDDENPLWQMFEELLSQSLDKAEVKKVHPSFVYIISQLSRDEAVILYRLKESTFEVIDVLDLNDKENRFENRRIEESNLPTEALLLPDKLELYYSHLESLSLVLWPVYRQEPIRDPGGKQTGIRRWSRMHLTDFGRLFANACIPETGFRLGAG